MGYLYSKDDTFTMQTPTEKTFYFFCIVERMKQTFLQVVAIPTSMYCEGFKLQVFIVVDVGIGFKS